MSTRLELRTAVRRQIGEIDTTYFTDADINNLLNEAERIFSGINGIIDADSGIALVQNQYLYDPPTDFLSSRYVLFEEEDKISYVDHRTLFNTLRSDPNQLHEPEFYSLWENQVRVFPIPNEDASATTLNGAINATDVTITVVSTDGFPRAGRMLIESEEIQYFDKTTTTFLQAVRGQGGTTAATHADTTVVKEANFRLFYYKTPKGMAADGDSPEIPLAYQDSLVYYAAAFLKAKAEIFDQSQFYLSVFNQMKFDAHGEIKRRQRDSNGRIFAGESRTILGNP